MAKYGMTMAALGFAHELADLGISSTALWPATLIATDAIGNLPGGEQMVAVSRKPDIVADAAYEVLTTAGQVLNGQTLIDEDLLRQRGTTDFAPYSMTGKDEGLATSSWADSLGPATTGRRCSGPLADAGLWPGAWGGGMAGPGTRSTSPPPEPTAQEADDVRRGPALPALAHRRGVRRPLLEQTIPDNLDATVARFGDREALVDVQQGIRWTYAEFAGEVERLARALLAAGVATGDRVGIWAPNCAEWTLTQYATAKIGAVLVNINPSYRTHELAYVLTQAGISSSSRPPSSRRPTTRRWSRRSAATARTCATWCSSAPPRGVLCWSARRRSPAEEVARVQAGLAPHDPINIQYTSGTTGPQVRR